VHQFFAGILPELGGKDEWIVKQFTKYMEWNSMTEFIGVEQGVFDYFVTHDDEDSRRWVRDTMHSFAKKNQNPPASLQFILPGLRHGHDSPGGYVLLGCFRSWGSKISTMGSPNHLA
jgi:hypothetical protein